MRRTNTQSYDSFNRFRISQIEDLFNNKLLYDRDLIRWSESITNNSGNASITHSSVNARARLYVEANDTVIRQSKQWLNYQAGKGQLINMTAVIGEKTAGVTKRLGYFNENNGFFFEQTEDDFKVVIRKNGTDNAVSQTDWNLDVLHGTDDSSLKLDESKGQIFVIDFAWLGIGIVRFGFVYDGVITYCHHFSHANILESVYTSTPNLPIRYEISSTSGTATLDQICSTVVSEGGASEDADGILHAESTGGTSGLTATNAGTDYALLGIRLKSGYLGATVIPQDITVLTTTNDNYRWTVSVNPTIAGTFTYSDYAGSPSTAVQTAKGSSSNTISDLGTIIEQGYANSRNTIGALLRFNNLRLGSEIDGTVDEIVLSINSLSPNAECFGTIGWREIY